MKAVILLQDFEDTMALGSGEAIMMKIGKRDAKHQGQIAHLVGLENGV